MQIILLPPARRATVIITRVFAIYQILLGWKTCTYYYETDELPNPRPAPPKIINRLKVAFGPLFPCEQIIFRGLGLILYWKQTTRNPTPPNSPQNTLPYIIHIIHIIHIRTRSALPGLPYIYIMKWEWMIYIIKWEWMI